MHKKFESIQDSFEAMFKDKELKDQKAKNSEALEQSIRAQFNNKKVQI